MPTRTYVGFHVAPPWAPPEPATEKANPTSVAVEAIDPGDPLSKNHPSHYDGITLESIQLVFVPYWYENEFCGHNNTINVAFLAGLQQNYSSTPPMAAICLTQTTTVPNSVPHQPTVIAHQKCTIYNKKKQNMTTMVPPPHRPPASLIFKVHPIAICCMIDINCRNTAM